MPPSFIYMEVWRQRQTFFVSLHVIASVTYGFCPKLLRGTVVTWQSLINFDYICGLTFIVTKEYEKRDYGAVDDVFSLLRMSGGSRSYSRGSK